MDNEIKGLHYDAIHIDEAAVEPDVTAIMEYVHQELAKHLGVSNGMFWGTITGRIIPRLCTKCQSEQWGHKVNQNHPFFKNNLEMLEWEYELSKL